MVGTILPIGYGARSRSQWSPAVIAFGAGAVGTGAIVGFGAAAGGRLVLDPLNVQALTIATSGAGVAALAYGLTDASLLNVPRLTTLRQVPSHWSRRYTPIVSSLFYGAGLGIGVLTRAPASFLALMLWCTLQGNPLAGAAAWAAYGLGRFLALVSVDVHGLGSGGRSIEATLDRLAVWERVAPWVIGMVAVVIGSYLLTTSAVQTP